jgi:outer membrane protein OmpA-like peptidoglycan-associated protein
MARLLVAIVAGLILVLPPVAHAQFGKFLEKTINDTTKRETKKAVNQGADAAYDEAKRGVKNGSGQAAPQQNGVGGGAASSGGGAQAGAQAAGAQAAAGATGAGAMVASGEVYSPRFDFVPGETVIYFDDFSDTPPSDYPSRWKKSSKGQAEVVDYQGRHWLRQIGDGRSMRAVENFLRVDLQKALPKKLTIEFDVPRSAAVGLSFAKEYWATGQPFIWIAPGKINSGYYSHGSKVGFAETGVTPVRHVSIALSGTNAKIYSDGERIQLNPELYNDASYVIRTIGVLFPDGTSEQDRMFTNFKVAEGGKDYAKDLAVAGRIVTHGITFDSGSDVIKPQSGPTLRNILTLLQDNASLRFEIQGHTDNQGGDKVNGPLSDRRAAAVKVWMVKQGVEEARLTAKGLGSTKPVDSNDTPEGRANNRRVEFVKLTTVGAR